VVVGSGAAGLTAALSAATRGATVRVYERAPVFGGTTAMSGGGMWFPRNPLGPTLGFKDSAEEAMLYLHRLTFGRVSESLLRDYVDRSPEVFDFLSSKTPMELEATDTPDYQTSLPGAQKGGRQVATGLYDTSRLGDMANFLRRGPSPGGIPAIRHGEYQKSGFGISRDWAKTARARSETGVVARGAAMVGALMEACVQQGVEFVASARVMKLVTTERKITGVVVDREGKSETCLATNGVVLATGGFEWNRQLWTDLIAAPLSSPLSPPTNDGDGLRMAMFARARLGNLGQVWWMPVVALPGETYDGQPRVRMGTAPKALPGAIVVNRKGRRFANEAMNYDDFGKIMVRFDPLTYEYSSLPCFVIVDQAYRDKYALLSHDVETVPPSDWLYEAPTIRELAQRIGVDPHGLENEITEFNRNTEEGLDPVFHRGEVGWERYRSDPRFKNPNLGPLAQPPYYAYELRVGCFGTKCGPVIDEGSRVLDLESKPVPGLFAAGNVTASVFGPAYPGGGSTLGPAVTFGYIAGQTATR